MTHKGRSCVAGAVVGAAVGAAVAYLYATDDGGHRREGVWRAVDRLRWDVREARQLWDELSGIWLQLQDDRHVVARPAPPRPRWPSDDVA